MAEQKTGDKKASRILALDALRLTAALVVFGQHFAVMFDYILPPYLTGWVFDAKGAVTLFFVLSGYVLALSLRRDPPSFGGYVKFGIRRVLRLYPVYWSALLLGFGVLVWIQHHGGFVKPPEMPSTFLNGEGLQLRQWLLQTTLVVPGMESDFAIPPVWTLMSEAKVAMVFPFLAWVLLRGRLVFAIGTLLFLIFGSAWLDAHVVGTAALLGQFGLGAMIARVPADFWSGLKKPVWVVIAAASVVLYCAVSFRYDLPSKWLSYYLCALGAAGLVVCAAFWAPFGRVFERMQSFLRVDLSYAIYILHYPIMSGMRKLWQDGTLALPLPVMLVIIAGMTVGLALLLYYLVEMPAIRLGRRLTSHQWFT